MLALALCCQLHEVRALPMDELESWRQFYQLFPFDDLHRYHRPAALIKASNANSFEELCQVLQPTPAPEGLSTADAQIMRMFGYR